MSVAEIQKMSNTERLRTMEALWDALCHDSEQPQSPEWHRDVLAERKIRINSEDANFLSVDAARERLLG